MEQWTIMHDTKRTRLQTVTGFQNTDQNIRQNLFIKHAKLQKINKWKVSYKKTALFAWLEQKATLFPATCANNNECYFLPTRNNTEGRFSSIIQPSSLKKKKNMKMVFL